MPIFGRKKHNTPQLVASIRDVPKYEDAIKFLGDWFDHEVVVERSHSLFCYGNLEFEGAWDGDNRVWMLFPSSINEKANFDDFLSLSLNALDSGFSEGTLVVGRRKTIINRNYIDGFINCMDEVYGYSWQKIQALIHKSKIFPILLITDILSFSIAPIIGKERNIHELSWVKGKYNPISKIVSQQQDITIKKIDISIDLNKFLKQVKDGGIVVVYRCPNCSAPIKVGKNTQIEQLSKCQHCGSEIEAMDIAAFLRTALS